MFFRFPDVFFDLSVHLPSGELTFCHGKSQVLMGKSTISMAIFHCYVSSPEGNYGLITIQSPFSYGFPMVFP